MPKKLDFVRITPQPQIIPYKLSIYVRKNLICLNKIYFHILTACCNLSTFIVPILSIFTFYFF